MDIFGRLSYFDCAPASLCTTKLLVMACNFNWFLKTPSRSDPDFRFKVVKPEARLIKTDYKSKQTFLPDPIREHFWLWNADSTFHYLLFFFLSIVSIMLILIMSVALMTWLPDEEQCTHSFPYAEATSIAVCCHYGVYADPRFFHFSASCLVLCWEQYRDLETSIVTLLCCASFRSTVRSS
jgi:hypothetical protein